MILNTGDIPNLYDNEERLEIIEKVTITVKILNIGTYMSEQTV